MKVNWTRPITALACLCALAFASVASAQGHNPKQFGRHDNGLHRGWYKNPPAWNQRRTWNSHRANDPQYRAYLQRQQSDWQRYQARQRSDWRNYEQRQVSQREAYLLRQHRSQTLVRHHRVWHPVRPHRVWHPVRPAHRPNDPQYRAYLKRRRSDWRRYEKRQRQDLKAHRAKERLERKLHHRP